MVNVDFRYARVCDHSALEAVQMLSQKYRKYGKEIHIYNLEIAPLDKAGDLVTISRLDEKSMKLSCSNSGFFCLKSTIDKSGGLT